MRRLSASALLAATVLAPRTSRACGSSGPDGISACSLAEYAEEQRPRWRVGASGVYTSTVISFNGFRAGETRYAGLAELVYAPTARLSLSAGLGVGVGGELVAPDGRHEFEPGVVGSVGVAYRFLDGRTRVGHGFIIGSGVVSFTGSSTQVGREGPSTAYDALDLRGGVAAGLTWLRTLSAYAVARLFGGPVFWSYEGTSQTGTDTHHYQLGGGLAVLVGKHVDLFAEGIPLGEQAVAAGASVAF